MTTDTLRERGTLILVTTAHPSLHQHELDGQIHPNLGRLIQPRHTSSIEKTAEAGIPWAADNDCFQSLDAAAYTRMLDRLAGVPGCLFVTVPDVVGDAVATLDLFETWAPELEARGLPAALVLQDGLEEMTDRIPWDRIVAVFVGGSTEWKESEAAAGLAREARSRGLWVHWGRVNTRRRFDLIVASGAADSFDGSKWARFRKTYLDQGLEWCLSTRTATCECGEWPVEEYGPRCPSCVVDDEAEDVEPDLPFEIIVHPDRAEAETPDAALAAARQLVEDQAGQGGSRRLLRADVIILRHGLYDGRLTTLARDGRATYDHNQEVLTVPDYRFTLDTRADDETDATIVAEVLEGAVRDERNNPDEPVLVSFRPLSGADVPTPRS